MDKRNAMILGATGLVGQNLLRQMLACDMYDKILALVRRPLDIQHPKLVQQQFNPDQLENFKTDFAVHDVFCALGTTIKTAGSKEAFKKVDFDYVVALGKWCAKNHVSKLMVVSAMGANPKSRVFYSQVKGEMENAISQMAIPQVQVFRPSLLMGQRTENRTGEKAAQGFMGALGFLFIGPLLKYKAIRADVVANAMLNAAKLNKPGFTAYESDVMQQMGEMQKT